MDKFPLLGTIVELTRVKVRESLEDDRIGEVYATCGEYVYIQLAKSNKRMECYLHEIKEYIPCEAI